MAKIMIGGTEYEVPEMNFLSIERAWPFVQEATNALDPMKGVSAALAVIASGLMEVEPFDKEHYGLEKEDPSPEYIHLHLTHFLKKKIKGSELGVVQNAMLEILKEAGLEVTEGEAIAALRAALGTEAEELTLSPETVLDTSSSSLQPGVKEEAGTS